MQIDDFDAIQPFDGAGNHPITFWLKKNKQTVYPVKFVKITSNEKNTGPISSHDNLETVLPKLQFNELEAFPIDSTNPTSEWVIVNRGGNKIVGKVGGQSNYTAYLGIRTEPHGVYLMEMQAEISDDVLLMKNQYDAGKTKLKQIPATRIERELVFPTLKGRDIERWHISQKIFVLNVQNEKNKTGIDEAIMKNDYPKAYEYLTNYKDILQNRKSRSAKMVFQKGGAWYSMYDVIPESLAKIKVVWRRMGNKFKAAVCTTEKVGLKEDSVLKPIIPIDNVCFIAFDNTEEAYYVSAILNSMLFRYILYSSSPSGRGLATPRILKNFSIKKYSERKQEHKDLAELALKCHEYASTGNESALVKSESSIDRIIYGLYGIDAEEKVLVEDGVKVVEKMAKI